MGAAGRLVAVLSTENSGSSLVTAILGGSPLVIAPPELHLYRFPEFDGTTSPPRVPSMILRGPTSLPLTLR